MKAKLFPITLIAAFLAIVSFGAVLVVSLSGGISSVAAQAEIGGLSEFWISPRNGDREKHSRKADSHLLRIYALPGHLSHIAVNFGNTKRARS